MFLYNSFNWFSKILTLIKEIFRLLTVFSRQSTGLSIDQLSHVRMFNWQCENKKDNSDQD